MATNAQISFHTPWISGEKKQEKIIKISRGEQKWANICSKQASLKSLKDKFGVLFIGPYFHLTQSVLHVWRPFITKNFQSLYFWHYLDAMLWHVNSCSNLASQNSLSPSQHTWRKTFTLLGYRSECYVLTLCISSVFKIPGDWHRCYRENKFLKCHIFMRCEVIFLFYVDIHFLHCLFLDAQWNGDHCF